MPFNPQKPFCIVYENGNAVIIQNGEKYNLDGTPLTLDNVQTITNEEIKEKKVINTYEPEPNKTTSYTANRKKQRRSKK